MRTLILVIITLATAARIRAGEVERDIRKRLAGLDGYDAMSAVERELTVLKAKQIKEAFATVITLWRDAADRDERERIARFLAEVPNVWTVDHSREGPLRRYVIGSDEDAAMLTAIADFRREAQERRLRERERAAAEVPMDRAACLRRLRAGWHVGRSVRKLRRDAEGAGFGWPVILRPPNLADVPAIVKRALPDLCDRALLDSYHVVLPLDGERRAFIVVGDRVTKRVTLPTGDEDDRGSGPE